MTSEDLSPADFLYMQRLVHEQTGVSLPPGKEYLVMARLQPLAKDAGLPSVAALIGKIRAGEPSLRDSAIEEMTTKETFFFRDIRPFTALRQHVIPELAARSPNRSLSLWSAAAATGQEAYSLAMMMTEYFPQLRPPNILATDYSRHALARAESGVYRQLEVNRGLPAPLLIKYFTQQGRDWQVVPQLRQLVRFQQVNLIRPLPPIPRQDVILLRNVLTYFEPETRTKVLESVARVLHPGGYLMLGGTETTYGLHDDFELVRFDNTVLYRLRDQVRK